MYRSSPLRSTLNTGYIKVRACVRVCTEAVHCVALWTQVTLRFGHVLELCVACVMKLWWSSKKCKLLTAANADVSKNKKQTLAPQTETGTKHRKTQKNKETKNNKHPWWYQQTKQENTDKHRNNTTIEHKQQTKTRNHVQQKTHNKLASKNKKQTLAPQTETGTKRKKKTRKTKKQKKQQTPLLSTLKQISVKAKIFQVKHMGICCTLWILSMDNQKTPQNNYQVLDFQDLAKSWIAKTWIYMKLYIFICSSLSWFYIYVFHVLIYLAPMSCLFDCTAHISIWVAGQGLSQQQQQAKGLAVIFD